MIFNDFIRTLLFHKRCILMRLNLFAFLVWIGAMQVHAETYAQQVTLRVENQPLEQVFQEIKEQTGFVFFYNSRELGNKRVDLHLQASNIEETMQACLKDLPFTYKVINNTILIKEADIRPVELPNIQQQTREIQGQVADQNGMPLPGVSIRLKESSTQTSTNEQGHFSLRVPEEAPGTLLFSYVGFATQEVPIGNQSKLNIVMEESASKLDEVVVLGYGSQRRSLLTSSVGSFKPDESDIRQVASPARLLEGRIAGVDMHLGSGNLGSAERISIRGASSISAGNEPLYVIDGVPINTSSTALFSFGESYSPLSVLNHADIESIEVLKDAASAAIYGSRASNGVVVITTRSGKEGPSKINVNISTGFSKFADPGKLEYSDSRLYVLQYNEGVRNYNAQYGLGIGDAGYKKPIANPFGDLPDTDWLGLITQTGYFKNIDASLSGGNEKTRYYIGVGYTDQQGVIKTNSIRKYNLNSKVSHQFTDWLEIGAHNTGNYIRNNQVPGASIGSTIIGRSIEQRPFDRPYKPNGDYYIGGTDELTRHNAVQIINEQDAFLDTYRYLGSYYGLVRLGDHWSFKSSVSADVGYTFDYKYYNAMHPYGTGVGRQVESNRLIVNMLTENILTWDRSFDDLSINAIAGHSFQKQTIRNNGIDGRGFPSPSLHAISVASEIYNGSGNRSQFALESYFTRATFSYLDKYLATATIRADGSSKFRRDERWGLFPSISFGWNLSKEPFITGDMDIKVRASYGQTGNQEGIGTYAYQALMSGGQNYRNESGISVSSFGNPFLTWEKADQFDIGFDIALLEGRLSFIADAYIKNTKDLLFSMPIHATTGMTSIISNIGSMQNKGIELGINTQFNLGEVNWQSQFNIAHNRNKITSLIGDNEAISIGGNRALQVGKELGAYYIFVMEGLYQHDEEVPEALYNLGVRAGDVRWRDVDGNDIINDNDRQIVGSSNPDFSGGWNNSFQYKGFQLDVLTTFMSGNDVYAQWKANGGAKIGFRYNQLKEYVVNRWTGPGTTDTYPRAIDGDIHNTRNSTRFLEDGSYIRIRALTLAYRFKPEQTERMGLKGLRVYVQADNPFLFTGYSGWDPEVNNNLDARFTGVDSFSVPQPRTFSIGVNVNL